MRPLALALALLTASAAAAQVDPARFHPAVSAEGILDVASGEVGQHLDADLALTLDGSLGPLRAGAHLIAALSLVDRLRLAVDLPVELAPGALDGLRVVPRLGLVRRADAGADLAIGVPVLAGPDGPTLNPELAISVFVDEVYLRVNSVLGYRFGAGPAAVNLGVAARWEAGRWADDRYGALVPADLEGSLVATAPFEGRLEDAVPLEAKLGLGYSLGPVRLSAGGGFALLPGGAPDVRAFAQARWADRIRDRDGDGLADDVDACPSVAEDRDRFHDWDGCPDPDNDEDGVPDLDDRCPWEAGPADRAGCP